MSAMRRSMTSSSRIPRRSRRTAEVRPPAGRRRQTGAKTADGAPIVLAPMIARVEPLTTTRRLSGPFDYALPAEPVDVGSIVSIPFGRQRLRGVVTAMAATSELEPGRLVAPTGVRADSLPPDLVELALWMAEE